MQLNQIVGHPRFLLYMALLTVALNTAYVWQEPAAAHGSFDAAVAATLEGVLLFALLTAALKAIGRTSLERDRFVDELAGREELLRKSTLELRRLLAEKQKTEERFQLVVEASPSAMIMAGEDGLIALVNAQTEKLFGYHRRELLGRPIEMLVPELFRAIHPDRRDAFFSAPAALAMGAGRELFGACKDGREIPIEIGLSPIGFDGKRFVLASIIDITERKRFEAELQSKAADMERFAYTVSHDLKSPLITIKSYTTIIDQDLAAGSVERARFELQRVGKAADRMHILLDEVLALSRVGRTQNTQETAAFASLVAEALELTAGRTQAGGVNVQVEPDLPFVTVDRPRMIEVLQNLIDNAAKFMGGQANPAILIGASNDVAETRFFVKDNGAGVDARYHKRIFGLFDKLDPKSEGSGAGLAIVKRIVEMHGGRIWIESAGSGGSTFWFTLAQSENRDRPQSKPANLEAHCKFS